LGRLYRIRPHATPVGTVIAAQVERLRGTNGAGTAHIMIPVAPGVITSTAQLDDVVVKVNSTEMAVELEALGRHPDGSYSIVRGRVAIASISAGSPITAEVTLGGTPTVARTTVGSQYGYSRNSADPRNSGYPEVVLVPTSASYLAASQLTGPYAVQTRSAVVALGGQYEVFWERLEDFSDWWWDGSATSTYGHSPASTNPMAVANCTTANASFPSYGDLTASADDFSTWRQAIGFVGGSTYPYNSYDAGKLLIEAWLATGTTKYLQRGLAYIAWYANEFIAFQSTGVNGFAAFPDGCAAYYLLTGDVSGKDAIERIADRFFRAVPAYFATPGGSPDGYGIGYGALAADSAGTERGLDQRETARILQTALAAHRIRATTSYDGVTRYACDYAGFADEIRNRVMMAPADGVMRKADGTWRNARCDDASGFYVSPFMINMLCIELAHYVDQMQGGSDSAVVTALGDFWSWARSTVWGIWDYNFTGAPEDWQTATIKSFRQDFGFHCAALDSPHPNNGDASTLTLMYPTMAAWLYKKTATASYLTQADETFDEGVGTSTTYGSGPTIGETGSGQLVSRKVFGEAQYKLMAYFTYRLGA
jgi:hypothetical protein